MATHTGKIQWGALSRPLSHSHVTVSVAPYGGGISLILTETDCNGNFSFSTNDTDRFWISSGHWIKQGSYYILDSGDRLRYGCCVGEGGVTYSDGNVIGGSSGYWYTTPGSSSQFLGTDTGIRGLNWSGHLLFVTAWARIGNPAQFLTCAGISVLITDACGHSASGTTDAGGIIADIDTHFDMDWTQVASASVTSMPPASAFIVAGGGGFQVYPTIAPGYFDLCINTGIGLSLDVTGLLTSAGGDIPATNPSNMHHYALDHYVRFAASAQGILCYRSNFSTPPFAIKEKVVTATATDADPHGAYDTRLQRLHCVFTRSGAVAGAYSDNDGASWIEGGTAPGKYPRIVVDPLIGDMLRAGYISNTLSGTMQAEGELAASATFTFTDQTGTSISVEDDSFDIVKLPGETGQWAGVWRVKDSGTCSLWLSGDKGHTWKKSYDCLEGCTRPRLEVDRYTGELLIVAYISNNLIGVYQAAGDLACSDQFELRDEGGALTVQNTTFDVSKSATERSSPWVLTAMRGSDTVPSEWRSGDRGETWKRIT